MAQTYDSNSKKAAYKHVDEALRMDTGDNMQDAYVQYLKSISAIAVALLEDAHAKRFPANYAQARTLMSVAKQCLERAEQIGHNLDFNENKDTSTGEILSAANNNNDSIGNITNSALKYGTVRPDTFELALLPNIVKPDNRSQTEDSLLLDLSVTQLDSMPSDSMELYATRQRGLSPLEQVERDNQQIMSAYKARLSRTQATGARMNLQLALQRRLAENMRLAEAKEKVLQLRNAERQKRILEQAARKIGSLQNGNPKEREAFKHLYAKVLEFEQDEHWPQDLKASFAERPNDYTLVDAIVKKTLSVPGHPLSQLLQGLQYKIYDEMVQLLSQNSYSLDHIKVPYGNETASSTRDKSSHHPTVEKEGLERTRTESIMCGDLPDLTALEEEAYKSLRRESNLNLFAEVVRSSADQVEQAIELGEEFTSQLEEQKALHNKLVKLHISSPKFAEQDVKLGPKQVSEKDLERLEVQALKRHLHNIVFDVRSALDKLLQMLLLTYEQLDSPECRDQCWISMEELFFKPLWPYLLKLFRLAYRDEEVRMAQVMTQLADATLNQLGVSQTYWGDLEHPYQEAIASMKMVTKHCSPLRKLDTLVQVAHIVCEDRSNPTTTKSIGADDLVPILCFVVIRTALPVLLSECYAMEQLVHEGYLMGEEGYCLTSLQTVFHYLQSQYQETKSE